MRLQNVSPTKSAAAMETFDANISRFAGKGGMYYVPVPAPVYARLKQPRPARLRVSTPDGANWKAGLMSLGNGEGYILIAQKLLRQQRWQPGQQLRVRLEPDTDEEVFAMNAEMREVLDTDAEAQALFAALTPGKQRGLIHHINSAKSSQVRINRALTLAANLRRYGSRASLPQLVKPAAG